MLVDDGMDRYINTAPALISLIRDNVVNNSNPIADCNIEYIPKEHYSKITCMPGRAIALPNRFIPALGLEDVATKEKLDEMHISFRGRKGTLESYHDDDDDDDDDSEVLIEVVETDVKMVAVGIQYPNIRYLGPHFLYVKTNITTPCFVGDRSESVIGRVPIDRLLTKHMNTKSIHEAMYLTYDAFEKSIMIGGDLHQLLTNDINYINVELFDENWRAIHFAQAYEGQLCYQLELEFVKGVCQHSFRI